jgi:hypothetical protein
MPKAERGRPRDRGLETVIWRGTHFPKLGGLTMSEGETGVGGEGAGQDPAGGAGGHSPQELSRALQAFKKRLKLTKLDSESKLGYGPMTGGRPSGIVAITPPNQYPRSVWDALVAQGRLKKGQQGMYELLS